MPKNKFSERDVEHIVTSSAKLNKKKDAIKLVWGLVLPHIKRHVEDPSPSVLPCVLYRFDVALTCSEGLLVMFSARLVHDGLRREIDILISSAGRETQLKSFNNLPMRLVPTIYDGLPTILTKAVGEFPKLMADILFVLNPY